MFLLVKKLVLTVFVGFIAYKGLGVYAWHSLANTVIAECTALEEMDALRMRKAPNAEVEQYMRITFSCVKEKQNFLHAYYFPIPDVWLNPPPGSVTYRDIPEF